LQSFSELNPYQPPESIADQQPHPWGRLMGVVSLTLALVAATALLFIAWHIRSDRTHRRPVIWFEGPAAPWAMQIAYGAWAINALAAAFGCNAQTSRLIVTRPGAIGVFLSMITFFVSVLTWAGLNED
jgi:hypothetical protein